MDPTIADDEHQLRAALIVAPALAAALFRGYVIAAPPGGGSHGLGALTAFLLGSWPLILGLFGLRHRPLLLLAMVSTIAPIGSFITTDIVPSAALFWWGALAGRPRMKFAKLAGLVLLVAPIILGTASPNQTVYLALSIGLIAVGSFVSAQLCGESVRVFFLSIAAAIPTLLRHIFFVQGAEVRMPAGAELPVMLACVAILAISVVGMRGTEIGVTESSL